MSRAVRRPGEVHHNHWYGPSRTIERVSQERGDAAHPPGRTLSAPSISACQSSCRDTWTKNRYALSVLVCPPFDLAASICYRRCPRAGHPWPQGGSNASPPQSHAPHFGRRLDRRPGVRRRERNRGPGHRWGDHRLTDVRWCRRRRHAADLLYNNGSVFGAGDWTWRAESGDWRFFFLDVPAEPADGSLFLTRTERDGGAPFTDIDTLIFGRSENQFQVLGDAVFGALSPLLGHRRQPFGDPVVGRDRQRL